MRRLTALSLPSPLVFLGFAVQCCSFQLAMVQTEHVVGLMEKLYPDITFEVVAMSTTGDQVCGQKPLRQGHFIDKDQVPML
jgi:hypothetical protein